jgi:hypothetical protein
MLDKAVRISAELVHMGLLEAPVSLRFPHDIIILTNSSSPAAIRME